jgi:hypothetical protein
VEGGTMTPNELLLWLSARKEGSWPQFRGAVETLELASDTSAAEQDTSLPLHQRVRFNLERLGHVEFGATECDNGWRVVPPALALCQHEKTVSGVLCGARTLKLLERIKNAANEFTFEAASHADCPDIVRMSAPRAELLTEAAKRAGMLCQVDAPAAILSHLPIVNSIKNRLHESVPISGREWEVKQFIIAKRIMKWRTVSVQEANSASAQGLFCFIRFQSPQYFLRHGRETMRVPGAIGKYFILSHRRKRVLRYDRKMELLSLPAICRPPLLTERALILCSGFPATVSLYRDQPILTYRDIPEEVAGMTAEVLNQDFI